jgi:hypothetical protein
MDDDVLAGVLHVRRYGILEKLLDLDAAPAEPVVEPGDVAVAVDVDVRLPERHRPIGDATLADALLLRQRAHAEGAQVGEPGRRLRIEIRHCRRYRREDAAGSREQVLFDRGERIEVLVAVDGELKPAVHRICQLAENAAGERVVGVQRGRVVDLAVVAGRLVRCLAEIRVVGPEELGDRPPRAFEWRPQRGDSLVLPQDFLDALVHAPNSIL